MRSFILGGGLAVMLVAACSAPSETSTSSAAADITDVSPTVAKEQSVPNCWLYSMASWAEAMHNGVAQEEVDLSESYWTYWHWYDQLTTRELAYDRAITTPLRFDPTGNWSVAAEIIARRGWMTEGEFLPDEGGKLRSQRQWEAERTIRALLAPGGALERPELRTDERVLAALDRAFGISPAMAQKLRAAFGADGRQTLNDTAQLVAGIHRATELSVQPAPGGPPLSLADVLGATPALGPGQSIIDTPRAGRWAWQVRTTQFTWDNASNGWNDGLVKSVQRTLHSHRPVYLFWAMDNHYLDATGTYQATLSPRYDRDDPALHLSVITDYEVENVPGFGLLRAGVREERPAALEAALDDRANVRFFRILNPWWGSYEANGHVNPFAASKDGYNDLTIDYLFGVGATWRRMRQVVLPSDILYPAPPSFIDL